MNTKPEAIDVQRQREQREERYSGWPMLASCFGPCSRTAAMAAHPEPAEDAKPARR